MILLNIPVCQISSSKKKYLFEIKQLKGKKGNTKLEKYHPTLQIH